VQLLDGELVLSATDLVNFRGCLHRTCLDREVALGLRERPDSTDPLAEILIRAGTAHEAGQLELLRHSGVDVVAIGPPAPGAEGLAAAEAETLAAMSAGAHVVYQATFFDPPWRGHADFLLRVEEPSGLGPWSYEVADAKLHRAARPSDWLQLAFYSDQVARLQGRVPDQAHVLLGNGERASAVVAESVDLLHNLEAELLAAVGAASDLGPEPNSSCTYCRWLPDCRAGWRAEGHLSLVGVDRRTRVKLVDAGITTVADLAGLGPDLTVEGVSRATLRKHRSDARLFLYGERTGVPHLRLRFPREDRGLALLPAAAEGDIFFDLEGYPFGDSGHLEYLWGLVSHGAQGDAYRCWWAHSPDEEAAAFSLLLDFIEEAVSAVPERHVYHYNHYEVTAMKRVAARAGGDAPDRVARVVDAVFVDLLPIARYSVRTSSMSASLKSLERFYRPARSGAVTDAAGSIVDYDRWLQDRDAGRLEAIEAYNRDDCESLAEMRVWLLGLAEDVAEARSGVANDPMLEEMATIPDLAERFVAASGHPDGGVLARRSLVALDYADEFDAEALAGLTGSTVESVQAALILGKKEAGVPIPQPEVGESGVS
jgi:predicted RecB family nuclease